MKSSSTTALVISVGAVIAQTAAATEGYFLEGYGTREKGVAGAGAADSRDPLALSINPAGLVDVGLQYTVGLTAFSPDGGYTTTGAGFVAPGRVQSGRGLFPISNEGYTSLIDATSAWDVAFYSNGGMNTTYSPYYPSQAYPSRICPSVGVYCGRNAGVDLNQAFEHTVSGIERTPLGPNPLAHHRHLAHRTRNHRRMDRVDTAPAPVLTATSRPYDCWA